MKDIKRESQGKPQSAPKPRRKRKTGAPKPPTIVESMINVMSMSLVKRQIAVLHYKDVLLAKEDDSAYDNESPSGIFFLDRFNDAVFDLPIWEVLGIEMDGDFDTVPVNGPELLTAYVNRQTYENVFACIQEARKNNVVHISEAACPDIAQQAKAQKNPLPLIVVIQQGAQFFTFRLPSAAPLADALIHHSVWQPVQSEQATEPATEPQTDAPA